MPSFQDSAILVFLALLLFGPKKLPEIARQVGKALNEFKRASNEFKAQIEAEVNQLEIQEREKKREQEQKILPPAEPPAGTVQSSSSSLSSSPEQGSLAAPESESRVAEAIAPPDTATHTNEMNPSTPHTTNA